MNQYQTIFTLFYTLYSAMAITITGKLQPFDTPSMFKWYPKSWLRFFYSLFLLNFLPLVCFVYVYKILGGVKDHEITTITALLLFLPSLVGLGFYRIYYGSMLCRNKNGYLFYDTDLYRKGKDSKKKKYKALPITLLNDLEARPSFHDEPLPHIIPGLFWVFISLSPILFFSYLF